MIILLRNAVEAQSDRIAVETHAVDGALEIVVSDTGCGMTGAELRTAFDPIQSTGAHAGELGLGLSLARAIVTSHGGSVDVRSEPGQGTTVAARVPVTAAPDDHED